MKLQKSLVIARHHTLLHMWGLAYQSHWISFSKYLYGTTPIKCQLVHSLFIRLAHTKYKNSLVYVTITEKALEPFNCSLNILNVFKAKDGSSMSVAASDKTFGSCHFS